MCFEPQTVEHKHVYISQRVHCLVRNQTQIRQVSKIVETISHHGQAAMNNFERRYLQFFTQTEARTRRDRVWNNFRQTAPEVRRLKDVFEDAFDIYPRALIRVNIERAKAKVQRSNVVETKHVIGVAVSDQNSVET